MPKSQQGRSADEQNKGRRGTGSAQDEGSAQAQRDARQTPHAQRERKQRVLAGQPAIVGSIADAVTVKHGDLFWVARPDGQVPLEGEHGFGLYFHDCRFLSGYEMLLAGLAPVVLASTAEKGYTALFELTNPDLHLGNGKLMPKEELGIRWERALDGERLTLNETLSFRSFGQHAHSIPLTLRFHADFRDVFAVRGLLTERLGRPEPAAWRDGKLTFVYHGADQVLRTVAVAFSPAPLRTEATAAHFRIALSPGEGATFAISVEVVEQREDARALAKARPASAPARKTAEKAADRSEERLGRQTKFHSDSLLLNSMVERSLLDLNMLRSELGAMHYFSAGVPWYVALFGRDSLIVALEMLAFQPEMAAETLRTLAAHQGQRVDDWRDEQPGKILHEFRLGELAGSGDIPHNPYYGTVDATPLFLVLLGRYAAWTGDLALFHELRPAVEGALEWIDRYGDHNGDGYVDYEGASEKGLINHGWKDSGDAIVRADGSLAAPPIALVEVQGYVFAAKQAIAELYQRAGDLDRAEQLRREAEALRERFNRDFWLEEHGIYALALEGDGRQVAVVSSNAGQALWTGIADADKARRTAGRLMANDMFNGWGVRTLSANERRYNPAGYHLGTVWPHDNALIAAGCRRYGEDAAAERILTGIAEAAMYFRYHRLPEVFAGFRRQDFGVPVNYPVACHPQAWAAGAIPFLLTSCLGLEPDAFANRLTVTRPSLPEFVDHLEISGLRVGRGSADLYFQRTPDGTAVDVLQTVGEIGVSVET